jgi:hypothetical protein
MGDFARRWIAGAAAAGVFLAAMGYVARARTTTTTTDSATLPYQGFLESSGVPVTGTRDLRFELCTTSSAQSPGDNCPWTELHAGVVIVAGTFSVTLGQFTDLDDSVLSGSRWLQVIVTDPVAGPVSLQGRQLLAATPFARRGAPSQDFNVDGNGTFGGNIVGGGTIIAQAGFGYAPLGTILPWHKSMTASPATSLPPGWLECNGQVVSDGASPYNGQALPDLNSGGRFLRGGNTSGTMQDDALQGHHHHVPNLTQRVGGRTGNSGAYEKNDGVFNTENATTIISDGAHGLPRVAAETRPLNMSVVWIMRVR